MITQFDWNQIQDGLYIFTPLMVALGAAIIGIGFPFVSLALSALTAPFTGGLGTVAVSSIIASGVGAAAGSLEIGMVGAAIGMYGGISELFSRALEVATNRYEQSYSQRNTTAPSYYVPDNWNYKPKRPIDVGGIPDIDYTHPNWRSLPLEEIANTFGVNSQALENVLNFSSYLSNLSNQLGINAQTMQQILNLINDGVSISEIADKFNLSSSILKKIF